MALEWIERDQGDFSTFEAAGRFTLEPEDLDFDEWSLWDGTSHVMDGSREQCEARANELSSNE